MHLHRRSVLAALLAAAVYPSARSPAEILPPDGNAELPPVTVPPPAPSLAPPDTAGLAATLPRPANLPA